MDSNKTAKNIEDISFTFSQNDLRVQVLAYKAIAYLKELNKLISLNSNNQDSKASQLICFIFSYEAKDFALLLRDSVLNLLKIEQFHRDGIRTDKDLQAYKNKLSDILTEASNSISESYCEKIDGKGESDPQWLHEESPDLFVVEQINELAIQIKTISRSQNKLDQLSLKFSDYRSTYFEHIDERKEKATQLEHYVLVLIKYIDALEDRFDKIVASKIVTKIQSTINELEKEKSLSPNQFIVLEDTDKLKLAVSTDKGNLVYKSVDILSEVSGWSSFNLISPLKTIDTKIRVYKEKVQVALFQLLNRIKAKLESAEDPGYTKSEILAPIERLQNDFNEDLGNLCFERLEKIRSELKRYIIPSQLFSEDQVFLPSSSVGQLSGFNERAELERRYNPARIKGIIGTYTSGLFTRYSTKDQLTAAGYIDNILSFDTENDANSLFLRNGFLGSSFSVDRPELMTRIDHHFQLWKSNYGGALLLSGGHLSGKSSLLEMIPLVYPETTSHHIVPGQKMDINGHKKIIGTDLIDTLKFIIKYKGPEKCIVTIDDLDYYTNNPEKTFELYDELATIISRYSRQIYFAIAMHRYLEDKLRHYFDLDNVFTEHLSSDYMPAAKIEEALLTRAHAISNNDEASTQSETLSAMARKVAKKANENVGKAMQLWCMYYNGEYEGDGGNSQFRALITKHARLLKTLIMHGKLKETEIRSMFNEVDARNLKLEIKALRQVRMLVRPEEGFIAINPLIVIFVESILDKQ